MLNVTITHDIQHPFLNRGRVRVSKPFTNTWMILNSKVGHTYNEKTYSYVQIHKHFDSFENDHEEKITQNKVQRNIPVNSS